MPGFVCSRFLRIVKPCLKPFRSQRLRIEERADGSNIGQTSAEFGSFDVEVEGDDEFVVSFWRSFDVEDSESVVGDEVAPGLKFFFISPKKLSNRSRTISTCMSVRPISFSASHRVILNMSATASTHIVVSGSSPFSTNGAIVCRLKVG